MKKNINVSIIGLGYVGLPLALLAAKKYPVTGIDVSKDKIASLENNISYIDDVSDEAISCTSAYFTSDESRIKDSSIIIVCVPTPVDEYKQPDLTPVKSAVIAAAKYLQEGALLIIESTINPGVCDEIIIPLLESITSYKVGKDIHLAHCPERINPGDPKWNVSNINRVVGSNSEYGLEAAYSFYDSIIDAEIKKMDTIKEAEAVKVVENSFRDINIAFVNELAMSFHTLGINVENVIAGAATKPFSFMPHHPSIGVGGHCIPVDPYYLIEYASSYGFQHRFLSLARDINENMPNFTLTLLKEAQTKSGQGERSVTLLGLSYKPNIGDMRESPALKMKALLESAGYAVDIYDPFFPDKSTILNLPDSLKKNSLVVMATNHTEFTDYITPEILGKSGVRVFIDGRNVFHAQRDDFRRWGIEYRGVGT